MFWFVLLYSQNAGTHSIPWRERSRSQVCHISVFSTVGLSKNSSNLIYYTYFVGRDTNCVTIGY